MGEPEVDYKKNLLRQYDHWSVYLHESQRYLGRTYIALARDGDLDPFTDLTTDEVAEFTVVVSGLKAVVSDLYQPLRLNYANLRNTWNHCHWHVVPRYDSPRELEGVTFIDENPTGNWAPYSPFAIPDSVHDRIRSDISDALHEIS